MLKWIDDYFSAQEHQFGTFGRPTLQNHHRATMEQRQSAYNQRLGLQSAASAQSEESLSQPIFQPTQNFTKQKEQIQCAVCLQCALFSEHCISSQL